MRRLGTGPQAWPLLSGSTDAPVPVAGNQTAFFLNTVPDRCPTGPLAYYLPFILLTIFGTFTQAGGAGSVVYWDKFWGALIDKVEVSGAWHGTPVSGNYVKGAHLAAWERIAMGRYAQFQRRRFSASNGDYPFTATCAIPLSAGSGNLMGDTTQLAKCYQTAQLKVNMAATSVITGLSTGSSIAYTAMRASAILVPRQALVLGTPVELILHSVVAGGALAQIKGVGTETGLTGVEQQGGVLSLHELTTYLDSSAAFASVNVTDFSFPFRNQVQTQHVLALAAIANLVQAQDRPNLGVESAATTTGTVDNNSFPYQQNADDTPATVLEQRNMIVWPFVPGSDDTRLTELQSANGDLPYNMTVTGGFSNSHLHIGHYAKSWQKPKRDAWLEMVMDEGPNSLASFVLGGPAAAAAAHSRGLGRRWPRDAHTASPDMATYLPWELV